MNILGWLAVPLLVTAPASLVKPLPNSPTTQSKGKATKKTPPTSDAVSTIPEIPSGLSEMFVRPREFQVAEPLRLSMFAMWLGPDTDGQAWAYVDIPAGASIEWMDCRVDMVPSKSPTTHPKFSGFASASLRSSDFQTGYLTDSNPLLTLEYELNQGASRYWKGARVPDNAQADAVAQTDRTFVIEVYLRSKDNAALRFRGCRVGYRT